MKKKVIVFLCLLFVAVCSTSAGTKAEETNAAKQYTAEYNGVVWHYTVNSKDDDHFAWNVYTDSSYTGELPSILDNHKVLSYGNDEILKPVISEASQGEIIIPDGVLRIESFAFYECKGITKITIPDTIAYIDMYAFAGCESLTAVDLPVSINGVSKSCFERCINLKEVNIPSSYEFIDDRAFAYCRSIEKVELPQSTTRIGEKAFINCYQLKEISLLEIETIGESAFCGCSNLKDITFSNKIKSIKEKAFFETGIKEVILSESLEEIGAEAFNDTAYAYMSCTCKAFPYAADKNMIASDSKYCFLGFKICYHANNGTGETKTIRYHYRNQIMFLPKQIFKKEGYKIVGWSSNPDDTGAQFTAGSFLNFCLFWEIDLGNLNQYTSYNVLYAAWEEGEAETEEDNGSNANQEEGFDSVADNSFNEIECKELFDPSIIVNCSAKEILIKGKNAYKTAVELSWEKRKTASSVKIYRTTKKDGEYKLIKTIKNPNDTKYIDSGVIKGSTFYYRITYEYTKEFFSEYHRNIECTLGKSLIKPQMSYQKNKKKLTIHFTKAEGTNYESQWRDADNKKWRDMKSTKGPLKKSIKKTIKAKKTFQIRFRTSMKIGKKTVKSPWSDSYTVRL